MANPPASPQGRHSAGKVGMAVYTHVNRDELANFLEGYGLGELISFEGITEGVENSNYCLCTKQGPLHTDERRYILTLYEKRVNPKDLPFFIEVMEVLANSGMNCPLPVPATNGKILGELKGRPCAVFTFLDGAWSPHPNTTQCTALGEALATLHNNCTRVKLERPNALGPSSWVPLLDSVDDDADIFSELTSKHGKITKQVVRDRLGGILAQWPRDLPGGVIHADLFPNNALFVGDDLTGIIDFYFACNDMFAYDIGVCINSWCFDEDESFNPEKSRAIIKGYQQVRRLDDAEIRAIPVLAAGAAMRFFLTRLYDWVNTPEDAQVRPKDPMEYWDILHFHRSVGDRSDYGIGL